MREKNLSFRNQTSTLRFYALSVLTLVGALMATLASAENNTATRDEIRAAFVFNIARFASWPKAPEFLASDRFQLCFYRDNYLGEATDSISGKLLHGRKLSITLIDDLKNINTCQILLISGTHLARYQHEAVNRVFTNTLTIADTSLSTEDPDSYRQVMMTIVRKRASLRLKVNLKAVQSSDLKISSELLKLAVIVGDDV